MAEYFTRDHLNRIVPVTERLVPAEAPEAGPAEAPAASTVLVPAPAPAAPADDGKVVLGIDANGREVTLEDFRKNGLGTWGSIVKLTSFGQRAKAALEEIRLEAPRSRAVALGIDTSRVEAWATANGVDPARALEGEAAMAELVAADRAREGLAPLSPVKAPAPTPPAAQSAFIKDVALLTRAAVLKIDVLAVEARAKAAGWDPVKVLKAEIELQEAVARSRA